MSSTLIDLQRIADSFLETDPYRWQALSQLFSAADAAALAVTFPDNGYKTVAGYDGQKTFDYRIRCLIRMGEQSPSRPKSLRAPWHALARDFLSSEYRASMAALTGCDLRNAPLEVNVFQYPPRGSQGPHPDQPDKIVTHALYFNESWNEEDGGCLTILRSSNPDDVVARVWPVVGNSAVLVRSDHSWHTVSPVAENCRVRRRALTATFYRPGCVSAVWPSLWERVRRRLRA